MENTRAPRIALLTGGIDKHYASGLSNALASIGISVDVICNSERDGWGAESLPSLKFLPLYASLQTCRSALSKVRAVLWTYLQIMRYTATSPAPIFHILWNYKFQYFDRTLLLIYFKLFGKRVVFTAHNVNAGERDGANTFLNRQSLRMQYRLVDSVFVHTERMKDQLVQEFGVKADKITVIPFATYDVVPQTTLTVEEAKKRLGVHMSDRTILFFGRIVPYKGLDLLIDAFARIAPKDPSFRLVIAGELMKEGEQQWRQVRQAIEQSQYREQVLQHIHFIADSEIEQYFKGADVLVLPYTQIFQSGVLFMAYSFGLPVIATDVGSFGEDIIAGATGFVCRPGDPADLARVIEGYFSSELFRTIDEQRGKIKAIIQSSHSWQIAAGTTGDVYARL